MGFHSSGQAAPLSVLYDLLGEKQTGADTVKKYFFFWVVGELRQKCRKGRERMEEAKRRES